MLNQTLFIPKTIQIQLRDKENRPIEHENIMVGIKTRANQKNNINIYPFLSDKMGYIKISEEDIREILISIFHMA
ncbi:hypothetical protein IDJ75_02570 [Mucilaginibacter rigui]|uniref:Uncharacterized protein n=1 Tax=Mucilaginibacter rigui TaxID=534635 RepID=A0ABR7X0P0_9SPHI|nr:hypothetical protein [Mucilaginibacter rigui]MBD1384148.1 hypothetical protein [Mucilaginibacter rigui]